MTVIFQTATAEEPETDERKAEAQQTERRRMWCVQQSMQIAFSALQMAPSKPVIDIMLTAEEMCEFIETGVARTHKDTSRTKQ